MWLVSTSSRSTDKISPVTTWKTFSMTAYATDSHGLYLQTACSTFCLLLVSLPAACLLQRIVVLYSTCLADLGPWHPASEVERSTRKRWLTAVHAQYVAVVCQLVRPCVAEQWEMNIFILYCLTTRALASLSCLLLTIGAETPWKTDPMSDFTDNFQVLTPYTFWEMSTVIEFFFFCRNILRGQKVASYQLLFHHNSKSVNLSVFIFSKAFMLPIFQKLYNLLNFWSIDYWLIICHAIKNKKN